MIIEFEPNRILISCPSKWWLYYKNDHDVEFKKISVTYEQLKLFLETYGYETNNLLELKKFGVDTTNIKNNTNLKWR